MTVPTASATIDTDPVSISMTIVDPEGGLTGVLEVDNLNASDVAFTSEPDTLQTQRTLLVWSRWIPGDVGVECTYFLEPKRGTELTEQEESLLVSMRDEMTEIISYLVMSGVAHDLLTLEKNDKHMQKVLLGDAKLGAEGTDFEVELWSDDMSMSKFAQRPSYFMVKSYLPSELEDTEAGHDEQEKQ